MLKNVKLSSPWAIYYNKILQLFGKDPDITITYFEDNNVIRLLVASTDKATALRQILPDVKHFGNVELKIEVYPPEIDKNNITAMYSAAFKDNPAFEEVREVTLPTGNVLNYVIFSPEVVQYYSDNLADIHGNTATLYQNIAVDIFDFNPAIRYCTAENDLYHRTRFVNRGAYKWVKEDDKF